jgi:hypothetical protein
MVREFVARLAGFVARGRLPKMNSIRWLAESFSHNLKIMDSFGSRELGEIDCIYRELAGLSRQQK